MLRLKSAFVYLFAIAIIACSFLELGNTRVQANRECEGCRKCCSYQVNCDCDETCETISPPCSEGNPAICRKN